MKRRGGRKNVEKKEEMLRRGESVGMLNIQLLVMRLPPHSLSSLECEERK
jgi:hypothetical protein